MFVEWKDELSLFPLTRLSSLQEQDVSSIAIFPPSIQYIVQRHLADS